MLGNLQGLRAFAAICVMLFHFGLMPATHLPFRIGAFGVDLFFVLSGFIIAYSSARRPEHFLAHRLSRVLPAYWIATLIAAATALRGMDLAPLAGWVGQSLLFLPGPGGRPALIFVGWTLVYELAFYLLYGVILWVNPRQAPILCLPVLVILAFDPLPIGFGPWPLMIEFALGIGIYLLMERAKPLRALPGPVGLGLAALGLAVLLIPPSVIGYNPDDYQSLQRVFCWGLPASAVILGLVLAERAGFALKNKTALLLGAASYAIYLLHPVAIGQILSLPPQPTAMSWLYCLIAGVITVAAAILFHRMIEAPILTRLYRAP